MVTPEDLIAYADRDAWGLALLEGWARAALAQPDPAWAAAMARWWLGFAPTDAQARYRSLIPELLGGRLRCLPPMAGRLVAERWIETAGGHGEPRAEVLTALPTPWSADFGHGYLAALREHLDAPDPRTGRPLAGWLRNAACRCTRLVARPLRGGATRVGPSRAD
jgi:hypothetical protein